MKRLILFLALLLLCGCAAGESAAPVPEGEFYLRFEMSYHEDSKFILDSTGSVTRGTESAQAEFDEEFIVDRSEDTANFCALCDELMELLHTVPEFIALPAPPPVL